MAMAMAPTLVPLPGLRHDRPARIGSPWRESRTGAPKGGWPIGLISVPDTRSTLATPKGNPLTTRPSMIKC